MEGSVTLQPTLQLKIGIPGPFRLEHDIGPTADPLESIPGLPRIAVPPARTNSSDPVPRSERSIR